MAENLSEGNLWMIALGAALADAEFRSNLVDNVAINAENPVVFSMLHALEDGNVSGVHSCAERFGFPVPEGGRCLPSLIAALQQRATSRRLSHIATSLSYCARLTPDDFPDMLKGYMEEMQGASPEAD